MVSLARVSLPASVTTEGSYHQEVFLRQHAWGHSLIFGVEEDASFSFNSFANGFNRSNMVSSTSFSRSKSPVAGDNSMDGAAFCLVTATLGTKFSMLHSIAFLPFCFLIIWEFLLKATKKKNQVQCLCV